MCVFFACRICWKSPARCGERAHMRVHACAGSRGGACATGAIVGKLLLPLHRAIGAGLDLRVLLCMCERAASEAGSVRVCQSGRV